MCEQCAGRVVAGSLIATRAGFDDSDEACILGLFKFTPVQYYKWKRNGNRIIFAGCVPQPNKKRENILILYLDRNGHLRCMPHIKGQGRKLRPADWESVSTSVESMNLWMGAGDDFDKKYGDIREELEDFLKLFGKEDCEHQAGSGRRMHV